MYFVGHLKAVAMVQGKIRHVNWANVPVYAVKAARGILRVVEV